MNTIKLGSKGEAVKVLQKYLGLNIDGIFGPKTELKVKEWQKANGLVVDGIVGPKSWEIILNQPYNYVGISDGMISFICKYETTKSFGYKMSYKDLYGYDLKDADGHKTYGYGLLVHPNGKYMDTIKKVWTQKELELIFLEYMRILSDKIDNWSITNKVSLNQNQKDAIASALYNFGDKFLNYKITKTIIANPNNPGIRNTWSHLSDSQGKKYPGLITRRKAEAKWYFEGK